MHRLYLFLSLALIALSVSAEPIPTLFNTGVDSAGRALPAGSPDPHYICVGTDPRFVGTNVSVVNEGWPIVPGAWLLNTAQSKWIAPNRIQGGAGGGNASSAVYIYQTQFDLTNFDTNTVVIKGRWASDNVGYEVFLNQTRTGFSNVNQFPVWTPFVLTNGFQAGTNTLTFVIMNGPDPRGANPAGIDPTKVPGVPPDPNVYLGPLGLSASTNDPTGFRVEFDGQACPLNPVPFITQQPVGLTVAEGDPASFLVLMSDCGQPLTYQWRFKGQALAGATGSQLVIPAATQDHMGLYDVVITNNRGAVTSQSANLVVGRRLSTGLFYTGVNDAGELLEGGEVDPHYTLVSSDDFEHPGPEAFVVGPGPFPPWLAQGSRSKWIAPRPEQNIGNTPGRFVFRTSFSIGHIDPSRLLIQGNWAADNSVPFIVVNGSEKNISNGSGFAGFARFELKEGLRPGINTIDFVLENGAGGVNPAGFRAELDLLDLGFQEETPFSFEILSTPKHELRLSGRKGFRYQIDYLDFFEDPLEMWIPLRTFTLEGSDVITFEDETDVLQRFYRGYQVP